MLSDIDRGPAPTCPTPYNLAADVLAAGVDDKTAIVVVTGGSRQTLTFKHLRQYVFSTATQLRKLGISPRDRVLMRIGNQIEFPILFLALTAMDAVPVISSAALTEPEVSAQIQIAKPEWVIKAEDVSCPDTDLPVIAAHTVVTNSQPLSEPTLGDPNRAGYVMFTSGTGAAPKAVLHAHRAVYARRMMWRDWYDLRADDRLCHAGAFNWSFTLGTGLLDPWAIGATAIIAPDCALLDLPMVLAQEKATIFAAAPAVLAKLLQSELPDFPKLRHVLAAGDVVSTSLKTDWSAKTNTRIYDAFGMTECSTFLSASPLRAPSLSVQSGRRIGVLQDEIPVARDQTGAIAVHRNDPGLMLGYLDSDTHHLPLSGDWFVTSDTGAMDANGRITFQGRSGDMMNAGGFRVSPFEVELALSADTGLQVAAAEIEVKANTRVIMAFVQTDNPQDISDMQARAIQTLARYKQPRAVIAVDSLPRNANGKILRNRLQAVWEGQNGQT